jgi:CheY-like chemotaxis protein
MILVVDDEPDLRFILRRIFEQAGHRVVEAVNGLDGLECVRVATPDLVVTDIMMPVMDGTVMIRKLRLEPATAGIPILAATGDAHFAAGADAVLAKPYQRDQILAAANALLAKKAEQL